MWESSRNVLTNVLTSCNDSHMNTTIATAAGNGITAADIEAFAAFIAGHDDGRGSFHAAKAAQETDEVCMTKFFRGDYQFRRAVVGTLAATYDEFRTEAGLA